MGRDDDSPTGKPLTRVRLRRRGQELLLTEGTYLLGRDASCHILLDDAKCSRRHARLVVRGDQVTIDDLGSMNGLYVNGVRVTAAQALFDGDWVTAGSEELEVCIGETRREPRQHVATVDEFTPVPSSNEEDAQLRISQPPDDSETTQKSRALEILASIADRALDAGRLQDAEDLLKVTLVDLLQEANLGHQIEPDSLEFSLRYSLRLAQASGKSRWFDYAVDILKSQRMPCTPSTAAALKLTLKRLSSVDVDRLQAYSKTLRQSSGEGVATAGRVEELVQEALRKRRP